MEVCEGGAGGGCTEVGEGGGEGGGAVGAGWVGGGGCRGITESIRSANTTWSNRSLL